MKNTFFIIFCFNFILGCSPKPPSLEQKKDKLDQLIADSIDEPEITGILMNINVPEKSINWRFAKGDLQADTPFFIASTTKLYITAAILRLVDGAALKLDAPAISFFPNGELQKIAIIHDKDFSDQITIRHLLSNTSGLPDYFEDKGPEGTILLESITSGHDQSWSFQDVLKLSKKIGSHFPPGTKNKVHYSDTNFQILGQIIAITTKKPIDLALEQLIFKPLRLTKTYVYTDPNDQKPANLRFQKKNLLIPKAMASFKADGGIVTTNDELMIFLKSFFEGGLFSKNHLSQLYHWNDIFFPLEYGVGLMRFKVPWIFSPLKSIPEMIGHSGLSGAFAYYCPVRGVFMTGTVNQIDNPSTSYRLLIKALDALN